MRDIQVIHEERKATNITRYEVASDPVGLTYKLRMTDDQKEALTKLVTKKVQKLEPWNHIVAETVFNRMKRIQSKTVPFEPKMVSQEQEIIESFIDCLTSELKLNEIKAEQKTIDETTDDEEDMGESDE